jgi:Tfp pilus assembly protein PilV
MNERLPSVQDEEGLTLIELIIAVGILGVVIIPVITAMLLGILETNATRDRIADSSSAQLTTAYLHGDIQSSQSVATTGDCVPASLTGGTVRLQFQWIDPATPATTTKASYIDFIEDGQHRLYRATCVGASTNDTFLVHHFDSLTVACDGATPCTAATPEEIEVTITAFSDAPNPGSSYTPFTFEIDGVRRVGS